MLLTLTDSKLEVKDEPYFPVWVIYNRYYFQVTKDVEKITERKFKKST